jgi:DNA-binding NarL/FixJ family response regulator
MDGFFIFFSLMLHLATFYIIFLLWKKNESTYQMKNTESADDVAVLLEQFSKEIKEENERLHDLIKKYADDKKVFKEDQPKKDSMNMEEEEAKPVPVEEQSSNVLDQQTNEVIQLANKGYNANEIAKMLNRGKGEIELLLKFYA